MVGTTRSVTLYLDNDVVYQLDVQPTGTTATRYVALNGKYLAVGGKYLAKVVRQGTNQPQTYFYHTDLVGSVRAITDSQGQVVARFEYEPFGVTTSASGALAGSPQAGGETHKVTLAASRAVVMGETSAAPLVNWEEGEHDGEAWSHR